MSDIQSVTHGATLYTSDKAITTNIPTKLENNNIVNEHPLSTVTNSKIVDTQGPFTFYLQCKLLNEILVGQYYVIKSGARIYPNVLYS